MVRPGHIVAQRLWRVMTKEDRAGMPDLRQQHVRIADSELQMLGRDLVGNVCGLVKILRQDDGPMVFPGAAGARLCGQAFQLLFHML